MSPSSERARSGSSRCVKRARGGACGGGVGGALLAEGVGTALLVLLSCLPACVPPSPAATPDLTPALASGLIVALLVQCLDHVSGAHFNPAVTLAAALRGRMSPLRAALYVLAQCGGAAVGALPLRALAPTAARPALCVTQPAPHLAPALALAVEGLLGALLALANCASWDPRNQALRDSWPLRIGLSVSGLSLVAGRLTGASMNPARSLGPALCASSWNHHWVYWAGPLGGALLGSLLYACAWSVPAADPAPAAALAAPLAPAGKPEV